MGMSLQSYKNMVSYLAKEGLNLKKAKIVELGDQMMHRDLQEYLKTKHLHFSQYMKSQGRPIVTIDIRGKIKGSLAEKIDLTKSIPRKYVGQFDLLTNFGTSEHVSDQYMVWKNMTSLVKPGGYLYQDIPFNGTWGNHGYVSYDYSTLAALEKFGLKTLNVFEEHKINRTQAGHVSLWVVQRKEKDRFLTRGMIGTPWLTHQSLT